MDQAKSTTPPRKNATSATAETKRPGDQNEGEGSRTAARRYDEGVERFVKSGGVEAAAKKAEQALEGPEGDELREAEEEARETEPEPEPKR